MEIFEGDILRWTEYKENSVFAQPFSYHEVKFEKGAWRINEELLENINARDIEITGNIHEDEYNLKRVITRRK